MKTEFLNASPESLGIPSKAIEEFLDELQEKKLCMHSFILLRHGKIAAEGYWQPFDAERKHRIYSISKSFTSIAVGMIINEEKLSLDSKVADFFPEHIPENPHPYVLKVTVRDLLMMSSCNSNYPYSSETFASVGTFFQGTEYKHISGQFFQYDTVGTDVLCALVEKISGKTLLEYMRPVLDEIGFSKDAYCLKITEGYSWGGSGIICTPRDLARFALLCMNKGQWNGKQLLNRDFMTAATSRQIDSSVNGFGFEGGFGYGYKFWCLRDKGFFMYGMGSQYALCLPEQDVILITTADTQGVDGAGDFIIDRFLRFCEKISDKPLAENHDVHRTLQERTGNLSLPLHEGAAETSVSRAISGKKYILDENESGMKWLRFHADSEKYRLEYENGSGTHELIFGTGHYESFNFPEKYSGKRMRQYDTHYECIGTGAWINERSFLGTVYAIDDYFGSIKFQLTFTDDEVSGYMLKAAEWFFEEYQGSISGRAV